MPVNPIHPGVYVKEDPSGVRTITDVATSIAAFIGRALRGPTDEDGPVTINSFGDFERVFGGLWVQSAISYAIRDFYLNGGSRAIVVRLHHPSGPDSSDKASLSRDGLNLEAAYPGAWGDKLRLRGDHDTRPAEPEEGGAKLLNLLVRDDETGLMEQFRNVSVDPEHPHSVDKALANKSAMVRVSGALPSDRPAAHDRLAAGQDVWGDDAPQIANTKVTDGERGSDGGALDLGDFIGRGDDRGLYALEKVGLFNLLCIPTDLATPEQKAILVGKAATYCERRRAMLLVDPPREWKSKQDAVNGVGFVGTTSGNAALFFPRLLQPSTLRDNRIDEFAPCGSVAGVMARTDSARGVWKAAAGHEATLVGAPKLSLSLSEAENGDLNQLGVNCLRAFRGTGPVICGARTLRGAAGPAKEWKYVPVLRLALHMEESLYRGTLGVVFEPNGERLWSQIRLNVGAFMHGLWKQGAFAGQTPGEAYFVKCDSETITQNDIDLGVVNIHVGFAPLKPAEFVILEIQQKAGRHVA